MNLASLDGPLHPSDGRPLPTLRTRSLSEGHAMKHAAPFFLWSATLLAFVTAASAGTTPDQVHRALETKQRIESRVASQLPASGAARDSNGAAATHPKPAAAAHGAPAAKPAAHEHSGPGGAGGPEDSHVGDVWARLLEGNRRFASGRTRARTVVAQREALVGGQHPDAIILACADSRVAPELLFDQSLGDLFVVRNAGNIADPIVLGSMEYAVEHLHAQLIVVLGHGSCGAVKAAASGEDMPSANLTAVVDKIRPTVQRLSNCFEGPELIERSVKANARQTAAELVSNSRILREAVDKGHLRIVSGFYDLTTGLVAPDPLPPATPVASNSSATNASTPAQSP